MTIDVWMQHPTQRFLHGDMFASLRRWTGGSIPETDIPIEATVSSMDAGGVTLGLLSAWRGPNGQDLISNDAVAEWVRLYPNRFARSGGGRPGSPDGGRPGVEAPSR